MDMATDGPVSLFDAFAAPIERPNAAALSEMATTWAQVLDERLAELPSDADQAEFDHVALERNTWLLAQALYSVRTNPDQPPIPSTSAKPYTPPAAVFGEIIASNPELQELNALRDWLTSLPSSLQPAEIRRGYLPYTKNKLKHAARSGATTSGRGSATLVRALDPDAVLRTDGGPAGTLEAEDVAYEKALLRSLFGYVRTGALDLAIDMCRQSDQSWRAASLAGAQPYLDRVVVPTEDETDDESMLPLRLPSSGNVNRRLWKAMARKLAGNVALSPYERALYGALSGDVASVLPVCETWEDQLWAHASALLEDHLERGLVTSRDGRFWTQAVAAGADASTASGGSSHAASVRDGLAEIFRRLDASERPSVRDASANIFHFAQRHLALGTVPELLDTFAARIQSLADDLDPRILADYVRFFAHLVLFLRALEVSLPDESSAAILQAYSRVLQSENKDDLVALYTAALPAEDAIETYARFLSDVHDSETTHDTRYAALARAETKGLDVAEVARTTVELNIARVLDEASEPRAHAMLDTPARLSKHQQDLISSIDWLMFSESTYPDAVRQSCALVRYFLTSGQPHAARELIGGFNPDVVNALAVQIRDRQDGALDLLFREFNAYRSLFDCLACYDRWMAVWLRKPKPGTSKVASRPFIDALQTIVDTSEAVFLALLRGAWLQFAPSDERRDAELRCIRQAYVPELVLRLHRILLDSSEHSPATLQRAIDLVGVVADEDNGLWPDFVSDEGNRMPELLDRARQASLIALDHGPSPFVVAA